MKIIEIDDYSVAAYEFLEQGMTREKQHEAAVTLLKNLLADCYGIRYEDKMLLKGEHGKPYFADHCAEFNVTHTKGLAACIICGNSRVGIDAELVREGRESTIRRFMTEKEKRQYEQLALEERKKYFFQIWTLKEAVAKAYGTGIGGNFAKPEFTLSKPPVSTEDGFWYYQWEVASGDERYIISAALEK